MSRHSFISACVMMTSLNFFTLIPLPFVNFGAVQAEALGEVGHEGSWPLALIPVIFESKDSLLLLGKPEPAPRVFFLGHFHRSWGLLRIWCLCDKIWIFHRDHCCCDRLFFYRRQVGSIARLPQYLGAEARCMRQTFLKARWLDESHLPAAALVG